MCRHRLLWMFGFALLAVTPALNAQTTTGTVRGYVKDQSAAGVPDAEVSARNIATGVQRSTATRSDGSYVLPGLPPATYELAVRKIGYTPQQRRVDVAVGATLISDFTVQAGAVELQAVTVESTPAIELRTSEVATNISQQQLQQLPTASRNFLDLAGLAPGVTASEDRVNSVSTRNFSAGGSSPNQVNVFVDGSSLKNDLTAGGVAGQDASRGNPFPRGAIQEYRVISQNFKAEYQKASSAIITATTRSGSNEWHGNALVGFQGKELMALDSFQVRDKHIADSIAEATGNPSTFKQPDYSRILTAFSAGGPLVRNKLFFFGSYEGNYQDRANRVAITTPTGFAALDTVNFAQYNGNFTSPFRETLLFGKLNYAIDERSSAEVSLNTRHETDVRDFGNQRSFPTAVNFGQDVTIGQVKYNRVSGGWLNETKIDYSRFKRNPAPNQPGTWQRIYDIPNQPAPQIGSDLSVQDFAQKRVGIRNDLTYTALAQHTVKAGLSVDFISYDIQKLNNVTPQFEYARFVNPGSWTFTVDSTTGVPFNFRNPFLMTYASGAGLINVKNTQVGAYFQDDWSPSTRLTLNLGLRWDYESNMLNTDYITPQNVVDTLTRYNDSLPTPLDLSRYTSTGSNRKPFYGAFQPRLGFAYALDENNVWTIFGGWGLYYDRSIFDFSVDEIQKLARPTYIVQFAHPDSTPSGNRVQWQDSYLTADTSVLSNLARTSGQPEAFLLDNKAKPPKSQQFNVGVRHTFGSWVAALSYQGQRGTDLFTYNWANFGLNSSGGCCVSFNIGAHGFRNFIYSTNDGKTWYDAVALQLDRPYSRRGQGLGWGGGLTYTYAKRSIAGVDNLNDISSSFPGAFPNTLGIGKHSDNGGNDERHRVVANWIMDIPRLWGIQFSGLMTLGSGARLDKGTPPRFGGIPGETYFPGAFAPPQYSFFVVGAWAYRRVDLRFRKDLPPISGTQLGVSLDLFNAFNFQNFGCYNTGNSQPGCLVSDPRRLQIAAEYTF